MPGQRHASSRASVRGAAGHALAEVGIEHGLAAVDARGLQHEIGVLPAP